MWCKTGRVKVNQYSLFVLFTLYTTGMSSLVVDGLGSHVRGSFSSVSVAVSELECPWVYPALIGYLLLIREKTGG